MDGTVTDADGNPVSDATVVASPQAALHPIAIHSFMDRVAQEIMRGGEADAPRAIQVRSKTGIDGTFQLDGVPAGNRVLLVQRADDPIQIRRDIKIREGKTIQVTVKTGP